MHLVCYKPWTVLVATELLIGTVPFQPNNINWMAGCLDLQSDLAFNWSSATLDCPAIHYDILSSNCGSCPTTTAHTTVICTDVPTDGSMCTFAVRIVACGNVIGNTSEPVSVNSTYTVPTTTLQTGQFIHA